MNELQIIQAQLATERQHFAEVAHACGTALGNGSFATSPDFVHACIDYFAFAATRLEAASAREAVEKLQATGSATSPVTAIAPRWLEFLQVFNSEVCRRFAALDALSARTMLVAEWRSVSRIDADSIFTERSRYARVKATLPADVALTVPPPS